MSRPTTCPRCGAPLPADTLPEMCPRCLLAKGLESDPEIIVTGARGRIPVPEPAEIAPLFPQLEILELLGRGGMGVVYKARQKNLDRLVALKILNVEAGSDPTFAERFAREARALATLSHPNVVGVHDSGEVGGRYYLLMEYVDGADLRQMIRVGRIAPRESLAIVSQICDALQYAHDTGIVHRDIKPENILVDRKGQVKIADFGLAKLLESPSDVTLTGTGQAMGTVHYMAPEQFEHPTEVDHRADIYSLGVVFYELLTGELPLGRFDPPSQRIEVDVRVDEVVLKTLEKDPPRRYQHASEIKTEVDGLTGSKVGSGRRVTPGEAAATVPPQKAGMSGLKIAALIVGVLLLFPALLVLFALLIPLYLGLSSGLSSVEGPTPSFETVEVPPSAPQSPSSIVARVSPKSPVRILRDSEVLSVGWLEGTVELPEMQWPGAKVMLQAKVEGDEPDPWLSTLKFASVLIKRHQSPNNNLLVEGILSIDGVATPIATYANGSITDKFANLELSFVVDPGIYPLGGVGQVTAEFQIVAPLFEYSTVRRAVNALGEPVLEDVFGEPPATPAPLEVGTTVLDFRVHPLESTSRVEFRFEKTLLTKQPVEGSIGLSSGSFDRADINAEALDTALNLWNAEVRLSTRSVTANVDDEGRENLVFMGDLAIGDVSKPIIAFCKGRISADRADLELKISIYPKDYGISVDGTVDLVFLLGCERR